MDIHLDVGIPLAAHIIIAFFGKSVNNLIDMPGLYFIVKTQPTIANPICHRLAVANNAIIAVLFCEL
jgi:hypothetical protein